MHSIKFPFPKVIGVLCFTAAMAHAGVKISQDTLGPDGQMFAGAVSPKGEHMAVLAAKGSHYAVIVDGAEGPRIDALIFNVAGDPYRPATYWSGAPIPVIFSKDGAHWAYMAKQGDNYIVMRDGQELARGPINTRNLSNAFNLTFSANGQHIFWSDTDAQGKLVIVADGKPGPALLYAPKLVLSADGDHYAYASYNRDGTGAWAIVDGRQADFFGDDLQYTARDVLLSTARANNASVFVINGKPSVKAYRLSPMWFSADGKQLAIVVTPQPGAPSFLTVNGKQIPGTEGLVIEKVYFSPDGNHFAALCDTKTNARFMLIDGKKGDEYPAIASQVVNDSGAHWRYVTWTQNRNDFGDLDPPLPGFTADSSKFVYVANSNGRLFLVINDDESNAFTNMLQPVLSPVGHRVAAAGFAPDNTQHLLVDGRDTSEGHRRISQLTFSPLGTHFAFILDSYTLCVDGTVQPGTMMGNYLFSPDDQHFAYETNDNGQQCLVVDGKVISAKAGMVNHIFFSPDSNHVCWVSTGNLAVQGYPGTKDSILLYVDGEPALHYTDNGTQLDPLTDSSATLHPEFSADDTMTFIARSDGNLRRFHLTPDTNLAALLVAAPAAK